jgi:hypothetical protein
VTARDLEPTRATPTTRVTRPALLTFSTRTRYPRIAAPPSLVGAAQRTAAVTRPPRRPDVALPMWGVDGDLVLVAVLPEVGAAGVVTVGIVPSHALTPSTYSPMLP